MSDVACVNRSDWWGWYPLHHAAFKGLALVCRELVHVLGLYAALRYVHVLGLYEALSYADTSSSRPSLASVCRELAHLK
jgi:hypothetical protein